MGRRRAVVALLLVASLSVRAESQPEGAIRALREAVARDEAAAVRLAAVGALAKIRDRSARPTLRAAADADPDAAVRKAAQKALEDLGPLSFSIDEPGGTGSAAAQIGRAS